MLHRSSLFISAFLMIIVAFIFLIIYRWSGFIKEKDYPKIQKKWYKVRTFYFIALLSVMITITIISMSDLPYHAPSAHAVSDYEQVDVKAVQFGWDMSENEFVVGDKVAFNVTATDVTHGFGIYNEDMLLLAQTQAMPEYTNTVYYTFTEPGTYQILCLEYCGLGHHVMVKEIHVVEGGGTHAS